MVWNCEISSNKNSMTVRNWDDPSNWIPHEIPKYNNNIELTNRWCWPLIIKNVTVLTIENRGGLFIYGGQLKNDVLLNDGNIFMVLAKLEVNELILKSGYWKIISSMVSCPSLNLNVHSVLDIKGDVSIRASVINIHSRIKLKPYSQLRVSKYIQTNQSFIEFEDNALLITTNINMQGHILLKLNSHVNKTQITLIECHNCQQFDISNIHLTVIPHSLNGRLLISNNTIQVMF